MQLDGYTVRFARQFTLAYLLGEVGLIGIALAAGRLACAPSEAMPELKAALACVSVVAGCGAAGGLCLRMAMGLVAGGVFGIVAIPVLLNFARAADQIIAR